MKRILTGLIMASIAVAFFSCKENDMEKRRQNELKQLDEFISAHYSGEEPKNSGLYYFELEEGTGDSILIGDQVQIYYKLQKLDSTLLTETTGYSEGHRFDPVSLVVLPPTQLSSSASYVEEMLGLHEALTYMKKDTKSLLILPSQLAFGQYGSYGSGGFTTLMMEVEVYKVRSSQPSEEEEEQAE